MTLKKLIFVAPVAPVTFKCRHLFVNVIVAELNVTSKFQKNVGEIFT